MVNIKRYLLVALGACVGFAGLYAAQIGITTPAGRSVSVQVVNSNVIRVSNTAASDAAPTDYAGILARDEAAASVVKHGNVQSLITTGGIVATIDAATGVLTISDGTGNTITDNGVRVIGGGRSALSLRTNATGSFYGAGERGHKLNLRGDTLVMYNRQNYGYGAGDPRISQMGITMPLFISTDGFAVVFDDYAAAEMILSNPIEYITESLRPVSYYYVKGAGSPAEVVEQLSALTGRQELPPFWALGYITSKYGYHTQAETLGVVDTLKRAGYPLDGIVLDLYWYGKEQDMGRLAWDAEQWPNPVKMLSQLKKKGVRLIPISQPYILRNGRGIDNYNELASKGLLLKDSLGGNQDVTIWVGEGGMFDVSNADTRAWLSNRYRELTDMGVTGWWGDLGEPEVHPTSGVHANGETTRQYHNRYGNDWSKIIYDLFKKQYPERRLMTMMRAGTTGLQRYSVFPWSTDVSRSWAGLQPQVTIMLNSGLSGMGYMGHDVGGFAVDPEHPYDPELYLRWLQLGTFSPVLRTHAQQYAEPYNYPQHADAVLALVKQRYRWLPYNYTLAWENATKGYPMVRPLNFYGGRAYDDISDEYLWGSEVLVAPVMTQGATSRTVTFPEGTDWVDYNFPEKTYSGGSTVEYAAPLERLPLFVRAGAIIPQADYAMQSTDDYNPGRMTIDYYPSDKVTPATTFTLYDDDRVSPDALEKKQYRTINFNADGEGLITAEAQGGYDGAPQVIDITVRIHNQGPGRRMTRISGADGSYEYDPNARVMTLRSKWNVAEPLQVIY